MEKTKFPITVNKVNIHRPIDDKFYDPKGCGKLVKVRPCNEKYENKTFLGILLGDMIIDDIVYYDNTQKSIEIHQHYNPAIFIPETNSVVFGCESWWGIIKDESELKNITNDDIQNIWYVKALKQMIEKK